MALKPIRDNADVLPIRPEPIVLETLVRASRMLDHAIGHSSGGNEIDRMIAVHGLDNACEYLLRVLSEHLELEQRTGKSFDISDLSSLAGESSKALLEHFAYRLPYLSELKRLRQVRNLVQHSALDPSGDIQRFVVIARRFFHRVLGDVFGLNGGQVASSALIDDPTVKGHLEAAEKAIAAKEYLKAVVASRDAFENAHYQRLLDSEITTSLLPGILDASVENGRGHWPLVAIKNELEFTRLGINSDDTRRFLEYVEYIPIEHRCDDWGRLLERDWNENDADFCYYFASSTALKWQSVDRAPVNKPNWDPSRYRHIEKLASIDLSETFEGDCTYAFESGDEMKLWYLDRPRKMQLERLKKGERYTYKWAAYEDGSLRRNGSFALTLNGIYSELTTNNPERWRVIVSYSVEEDSLIFLDAEDPKEASDNGTVGSDVEFSKSR